MRSSRGVHPAMLLASLLLAAGCSRGLNVGQVSGQLLVDGAPAPEVMVQFVPAQGVEGPASSGLTDSEGRFQLEYRERGKGAHPGAMVGSHIVTLSDQRLAASADGRGVKVRFGPDYTTVGTSPLRQEVAPGDQQVTIEVK
ncbi:hypothetical protein Pla175_29820 [Pirellulimonas nuda]|uniref:Carboxypeptidase regulatory-like domain-containing protein n=1 Tax=Pirellulimonas nuda TaxID=2528009 RepID=A0A518DDP2_9BACT|nr:hypothetical protein [Pirellulimonas nuda]QDU89590.1 hypothetical protein Pla175_29820 [Pirellulimonas nuda]